jgi:hypothetical protein
VTRRSPGRTSPFTSADACSIAVRARSSSARATCWLRVLQLHAGVVQGRQPTGTLGLRPSESGFRFGKTRLKQGGIESRDHLAGRDGRGEVDRQRCDGAGHLRAHLHHPRGLERSTDQESSRNRTARYICGLHVKVVFIASDPDNRHDRPAGNCCQDPRRSPSIRPVHNSQDTTVLSLPMR